MGLGPSEDLEYATQPVSFVGANLDAFSRLRVSNPETIFDAIFKRDKQPLVFWESTTSSATVSHLGNNPSVQLSCSTTTGSTAVFQSRTYVQYSPAKSNLILMTGNFIETKTGVTKRIGYFDVSDGYFFELSGSTMSFVVRSKVSGSVVDDKVSQSSWNLDKLDGSGESGYTLDVTKQIVMIIDFQWLGSGRVRFGYCIDGIIIFCHQFVHSNILTVPYSRTAKLPIRVEISNAGSNTSSMNFTCCSVLSEGHANWDGIYRTINSDVTPISFTTTALKPIISIRKNASYINELVQIISTSLFVGSADDFLVSIFKNPTLTGATWASSVGFCDKDVAATAISGGIEIYSTYVRGASTANSVSELSDLSDSLITFLGDNNGTSEIITLAAKNITQTATAYGRINFVEYI